jgi:hypothetical protein
MYEQFSTDTESETSGILLNYGEFRITIARAGGANKKFIRLLETKTKPYRRAIQTDTMDNERGNAILIAVYSEAIILNWERRDEKGKDKWTQGIEAPPGAKQATLPFNRENVVVTLTDLPELFLDIQEQASKAALFRQDVLEEDAKN